MVVRMINDLLAVFYFGIPELVLWIGIVIVCLCYVVLVSLGIRGRSPLIFKSVLLIVLLVHAYVSVSPVLEGNYDIWEFINNSLFWISTDVSIIKAIFAFVIFYVTYAHLVKIGKNIGANELVPVDSKMFEFVLLVLLTLLGMDVCISANNLVVFYLGLELQSFCIFILLFSAAETYAAVRASIVYFLSVLFSSILFLLGVSYVYYRFGSLNLNELWVSIYTVSTHGLGLGYLDVVMLSLLLLGLFVKVGLFPVHLWIPEVYTYGGVFPVSLIATVSKVFGFIILLHFFLICSSQSGFFVFISFMGACAIVHGVFGGLTQRHLRSLLGYSAIAHMGYVSLLLGSNTPGASAFAFFYILAYLFNLIPIFVFLLTVRWTGGVKDPRGEFSRVSDFANVRRADSSDVGTLLIISTFFFSFLGVPPFIGFFAKYYLIGVLVYGNQFLWTFIVLLFSVISAFYYLKVVKAILFDSSSDLEVFENNSSPGFWFIPLNTKIIIIVFGVINIFAVFFVPVLMFAIQHMVFF